MNNKEEKIILQELSLIAKGGKYSAEQIAYIASCLTVCSVKIKAKAIWLMGEAGFKCPNSVCAYVPQIAENMRSNDDLLRERALNALGRIGKSEFVLSALYFTEMVSLAHDTAPNVRLAFIWACENIAVNTPEIFNDIMPVFAGLLDDENIRVRIEAPEVFRVIEKRKPELVKPYLDTLRKIDNTDENEVVRIHANEAIKATMKTR